MNDRTENTFFQGQPDTAYESTVRPPVRVNHNVDVLPAYAGDRANWAFIGWYGQCTCGWASVTYSYRGFADSIANRHIRVHQ